MNLQRLRVFWVSLLLLRPVTRDSSRNLPPDPPVTRVFNFGNVEFGSPRGRAEVEGGAQGRDLRRGRHPGPSYPTFSSENLH